MSSVLAEDFFEKIGLAPSTHHLFFPILIMIEDPASEISVFFDSSLKSWVLLLSVPPGRSLYTDLAGNEQLEFLLKISVITRENDQKLEPYQFFTKKQSESVDSFKNEAELQQNISVDSARYGSDEICVLTATKQIDMNKINRIITKINQNSFDRECEEFIREYFLPDIKANLYENELSTLRRSYVGLINNYVHIISEAIRENPQLQMAGKKKRQTKKYKTKNYKRKNHKKNRKTKKI